MKTSYTCIHVYTLANSGSAGRFSLIEKWFPIVQYPTLALEESFLFYLNENMLKVK